MLELRRIVKIMAVTVTLVWSMQSQALVVDGINTFAPIASERGDGVVNAQRLELRLGNGSIVTIQPWPKFLPSNLADQTVSGERQIWPAGPSEWFSFTRTHERKPWLLIGSNSRRATPIVNDWHVQLIQEKWYVTNGRQKKLLRLSAGKALPVWITAGKANWNVYMLQAVVPEKTNIVSIEQEPRISWVAVRTAQEPKKAANSKKGN